MRENTLRHKFDRYVRTNPLDPDLLRKAYSACAPKLARRRPWTDQDRK
jgi:hypothetical protein